MRISAMNKNNTCYGRGTNNEHDEEMDLGWILPDLPQSTYVRVDWG